MERMEVEGKDVRYMEREKRERERERNRDLE